MIPIERLSIDQFYKRLEQYFVATVASAQAREFESSIDQQLYERLDEEWSHGWDFEIRNEFFGEREVSILIQNRLLDWRPIWVWLKSKFPDLPLGAVINFEVFDNIHDGVMDSNQMLLHRVIISSGVLEEETTEATIPE